jgi:BlaI family transcriptional regulator, penicillinase repressor
MAKNNPHITDAELEILKLLWDSPGFTIRELTISLYGEPTTSHIGTVQKLIQRLEAKQLIQRDRSQFAHTFSAKVSQSDVAGMQLDELARKVTGGSLLPFISHLVQGRRLSPREKEEIRKLLGEGD